MPSHTDCQAVDEHGRPRGESDRRLALAWGALTARASSPGPAEFVAALVAEVYRRSVPGEDGDSATDIVAQTLPLAVRLIEAEDLGWAGVEQSTSDAWIARGSDAGVDLSPEPLEDENPEQDSSAADDEVPPRDGAEPSGAEPPTPDVSPDSPWGEFRGPFGERAKALEDRISKAKRSLRQLLPRSKVGARAWALERIDGRLIKERMRGDKGDGTKCCIDEFQYPDSWQPIAQKASTGRRKVGVHLEARALYDPEKKGCLCECCQFEQFVLLQNLREPVQDCAWLDRKTNRWKPVAASQMEGEDVPQGAPVLCAGDRVEPTLEDFAWTVAGTKYETPCKMTFVDTPGVTYSTAKKGGRAAVHYLGLYIGVIWDMCHGIPKDVGMFEITFGSKQGNFKPGSEWSGDFTRPPLKVVQRPKYQRRDPRVKDPDNDFRAPNDMR